MTSVRKALACASAMAILALALSLAVGGASAAPPRGGSQGVGGGPEGASLDLFKRTVRPILLARCVKCHGGEKTRGSFDLTSREGLLHPGDDGPNVKPGDAAGSRLMKLVRREEEPFMPDKGAKLADEEIAAIAKWIDLGAAYDKPLVEKAGAARPHPVVTAEDRKFWAFLPLSSPAAPQVKNAAWVRTDIDRFVLAAMEEKGVAPSAPADRRKLIRRAFFDLVGLPPTPEEIEAFAKDPDPRAYEKLIDRLLANPHYGERWARHWLDVARFAESHGYEQDDDRPNAWPFRDFVIRALNENMPFDRFVRLQVAGDEAEPANPWALAATGFLAAGTHATQITASQVEKERYDELDDMASTCGTAFLGMTVGCARCHDHKFDPIPQKDYYRLLSTFTTTVRSEVDLDFRPETYAKAKAAFDERHRTFADAVAQFRKSVAPARAAEWLAQADAKLGARWLALDMSKLASKGGAKFTVLPDGSALAGGENPDFDTYSLKFEAPAALDILQALRIEALADQSLPVHGPGRAANGNFALSDVKLFVRGKDGKDIALKLARPRATFEQKGLAVANTLDKDAKSAWAVDPQFGKDHAAAYEIEGELDPAKLAQDGKPAALMLVLKFENNKQHAIGRLRVSIATSADLALQGRPTPIGAAERATAALATAPGERTQKDQDALIEWTVLGDADYLKLLKAEEDDLAQAPRPALTRVMIATEGLPALRLRTQGADFFEQTFFLKRGDLGQKEGVATESFMQVLMNDGPAQEKKWIVPPPQGWRTSYRRTSLANWLCDVEQGAGALLARVAVNRIWQHHFGKGLVETPNDFGAQGDKPSNPALLEMLASEFVRSGWDMKAMHKLIMMSSAYMESSAPSATGEKLDPDDLLLSRRPMRRLDAEVIRDAMLAVSGRLDATMFGPGTLDESMTRRSIYFFVKRSKIIPMMLLFDAPNALSGIGDRVPTTVAPQALALMNNPQVQACAAAFARRVANDVGKGNGDDALAKCAARACWLALGRGPDSEEAQASVEFIERQTAELQGAKVPDARGAALARFCQALFCLNEFVYVE